MDLKDYGAVPSHNGLPGIPARVSAQHKERYELVTEFGICYARLKTKEYYLNRETFPTVGDYVMVRYLENGDSQILATLPRQSYFSRWEPGPVPREQAVAANFDYVFVLQSLNQNFNLRRMERYLTMAWQSGATPVIVLTKADLAVSCQDYLAKLAEIAVGVKICPVSAHSGYGLEALKPYLLPGKTLVLLGSSGVGKSSLVNALAGETVMAVNGIREADGRGHHTTTHRQLLRLNSGALIIDTPGMRELGMTEAAEGLMEAFSDVEQYLGRCRFSDCRHAREPGCAIRAALASGELEPARWESYQKLHAEAVSHEQVLRRKREWAKNVAKANKERKRKNDD
ncbi:MAG: ribosome small subunit-dependent GTPase A [Oscillospiraceae bacterium]|nr:ribosome small subunit-dependent GTPase A [Oscillospiraceae bacterium]